MPRSRPGGRRSGAIKAAVSAPILSFRKDRRPLWPDTGFSDLDGSLPTGDVGPLRDVRISRRLYAIKRMMDFDKIMAFLSRKSPFWLEVLLFIFIISYAAINYLI